MVGCRTRPSLGPAVMSVCYQGIRQLATASSLFEPRSALDAIVVLAMASLSDVADSPPPPASRSDIQVRSASGKG